MKKDFLHGEEELLPKVKLLFNAVIELMHEGADVNNLKISDITGKAGIGKGTAYDYFASKEEIIGGSVLYYICKFLEGVEEGVKDIPCFQDRVNYLFDVLERNLDERGCFVRLVHLLMGSSSISLYLQDAIRSGRADMPLVILDKIVHNGIEQGEITNAYPVSYIVYTLCARILTYAALLDMKGEERPLYADEVDKKQIRELMVKGIMLEFGDKSFY